MISGTVKAGREPVAWLTILRPDRRSEEIEAVIDTGFTGSLTLPPDLVARLGLTFVTTDAARLADGTRVALDVYRATVLWDGAARQINAMQTGRVPLVGMSLLRGHRLTIDAVDGGPVTIGPIS